VTRGWLRLVLPVVLLAVTLPGLIGRGGALPMTELLLALIGGAVLAGGVAFAIYPRGAAR
jgi:hypothetical protein